MKKRYILMLILAIIIFAVIWSLMPAPKAESNNEFEIYYNSTTPEPSPTETCRPVSDLSCVTTPSPKVKKKQKDKPAWQTYTITAYCSCAKCCGKWAARQGKVIRGASGEPLVNGSSIAMPDNVPFGTRVDIKGWGTYIVQDRTGSKVANMYDGKIIDIYCSTHAEAVDIAKSERKVRIYD